MSDRAITGRPTAVVIGASASGLLAAASLAEFAVGQDALYPGASDTPATAVEKLLARYVDRCVETGAANPRALNALLDVMSLLEPPTRLFSPDMLRPMLFGPKRKLLPGAPLREQERKAALN